MSKTETPGEIYDSLIGKKIEDVDLEEVVARIKAAKSRRQQVEESHNAKVVSAANDTDTNDTDIVAVVNSTTEEKDRGTKAAKQQKPEKKKSKKKVNEDFFVRAGAYIFFSAYAILQVGFIASWISNGANKDILFMTFLPTIIVVGLFAISFIIDFITILVNKGKTADSKQSSYSKYQNKYNKSKCRKKRGGK